MLHLRARDRAAAPRSRCRGRCSSRAAAHPPRSPRGRAPSCAPGGPRARPPRAPPPASRSARPRTLRTRLSRISWLASSMSSKRPVSFHQPCTMCGSTRRPPSTRCWIASVISSSPRAEGAIARAASWMRAVNMYTPTSARSVAGCAGFSTSRTTLRVVSGMGGRDHPPARAPPRRSSRGRPPASAGSAPPGRARGTPPRGRRSPLQQVVPEVHHERARPRGTPPR